MDLEDLVKNDLEKKDGIFYLRDQPPFSYSDGDATESYILGAINDAKDISSDSRELETKIKDWPSRYHLSRERPLAYRSLEFPASASVLEVGCGCGAVTRFLGERVARVVALEGSPRRAKIARARTRNLESVTVLCGSFQQIVFDSRFDFVICNGVLEYAPLFVEHDDPARELIRLLVSLLAPTGNLVVAIENKLGLRYFASGKEEHTNIMFDGLEGYARFPKGPATFGFLELHGMLSERCAFVETLLPLPDYKLPTAIIRAELLDEANCADLFATVSRHDFGSHVDPHMHERLVWHELQKNHLMKMFANSYFMIAGHQEISLLGRDWLGDIYAINRNPGLMVRTTISREKGGEIRTTKRYLESSGGVPTNRAAPNHILDESPWVNGVSIHTMIARGMLRSGVDLSLEERLEDPIVAWWKGISILGLQDGAFRGEALDCIWQNAILNSGKVSFIDKEWTSREQIEPLSIIYRSVANFATHEKFYRCRWDRSCQNASQMKLMRAVARILGIEITFHSLIAAIDCNLTVLEGVYGERSSGFKRLVRLSILFVDIFMPVNISKSKDKLIRKSQAISRKLRELPGRILGRS